MIYDANGMKIEVNDQTINDIVETLLSASERSIEDLSQISEDEIRLAAHKFLAVVEYEQKTISQFEYILNEKKKWESDYLKQHKGVDDAKEKMRSSAAYSNFNSQIKAMKKDVTMLQSIQNVYKAGMAFQDIINKTLKQNPILTYVASNKTEVGIYEVPLREAFTKKMLNVDISSDGKITMRFKGSYTLLEKYANAVDTEIKKLETQRGTEDKPILDKTYKEVMRRFNTYKLEAPKNKVVSVVLWKHSGDWMKMLPSSAGDINEAYANYYIQGLVDAKDVSNKDLSDKGSMDENINSFMALVAEVDNARGRLIGDISVSLKDGGSLDYAIKSAGASVASLTSLLEMAHLVIEADKNKVKDALLLMKQSDNEQKKFRNIATKLTKDDMVYQVQKKVKTLIDPLNNKNFEV